MVTRRSAGFIGLAVWALCSLSGHAQPVATLAPVAKQQFFTSAGAVCTSCTLTTYTAGTTTPLATCTTSSMSAAATCTTANDNPLTLDSAGRTASGLYLIPGLTYKFLLKTSGGTTIWEQDNIGSLQHVAMDRLRVAANSATIASGAITVSESAYAVDTESAAASDDLTTLTVGTAIGAGSLVVLTPANVARVVTVRHDSGGGNIRLAGGDYALNATGSSLTLYYNGSNWIEVARAQRSAAFDISACTGRLTLTTGTPVTTADVTAAGTIYFTPYLGNRCALFDGTDWHPYTFTERSLALTATSGVNYDVFLYDNAGTLTLETTAWTNDTTRATALTTQHGVLVRTGATTRRYLGTFRASGTNQTEDSFAKRFVWNYYHRQPRVLRVMEATDTWTYTTATYRQANNSTANQLAVVVGVAGTPIDVMVVAFASNTNADVNPIVAIGEDSTTTKHASCVVQFTGTSAAGRFVGASASLRTYPSVGYHVYVWLEQSTATGTTTWYGDNGAALIQTGIHGVLQG